MRLPHLAVPLAFACGVCSHAAPFDEHVGALFRPLLGGSIALSPAGQRIAYTSQSGGELELLVINLERPGPPRKLRVESAADADPSAPPLRFLRWATEDRLIFAPAERIVPLPAITDRRGRSTPNPDGPAILAPICFVDADVRQEGTLIDARHFMETPANSVRTLADLLRTPMELAASRTRDEPVRWRMPHLDIIGFDPGDRERLVIRTRGAYSPPMQHAVDIRTGHVSQFGGELPLPAGEVQVFDSYRLTVVGERREAQRPATVWHDDELQRVQQELEAKFPQRLVEILDWSESRSRVLFRVSGGRDPGRVFLFQREEDLALEVLRLAPWLNPARLHDTRFFEFNGPDGASLSGYLTWPGRPVRTPPPLLVVFPSGFPGQAQAAFDPEAQALAELGFAVARLNHRWVGAYRGTIRVHAAEPPTVYPSRTPAQRWPGSPRGTRNARSTPPAWPPWAGASADSSPCGRCSFSPQCSGAALRSTSRTNSRRGCSSPRGRTGLSCPS